MPANKHIQFPNPIGVQLQQDRLQEVDTDIILHSGLHTFPAHRAVLRHASPFFKALLSPPWKLANTSSPVFRIDDQFVEPELMESLLTYFYTREITLTPDNAHALCIAAHYLQADELLTACEKYLIGKVTAGNVVDLAYLADVLQLNHLLAACAEPLYHDWSLLDHFRLMQLTKDGLELLACELAKKPIGREPALDLINKWVQHDPTTRDMPATFLVVSVCASYPKTSDHLFIVGGVSRTRYGHPEHLSSVSRFDAETERWEVMSPMANERSDFAGTVLGSQIYICGGVEYQLYFPDYERSFAVYDLSTDTWVAFPETPFISTFCSTVTALNDRLYFTVNVSGNHQDAVYYYHPASENWRSVQRMQVRRTGHRVVALGDCLYAIGGHDSGKTVERYDPFEDYWYIVAPTNYDHVEHTVAVHDKMIYVYSQAGFEGYDPQGDTWTILTPADTEATHGSTLASVNGQLLLIGGADQNGRPSAAVYCYNGYADQWSRLPDMDVARAKHCSFVINTSGDSSSSSLSL